MKTFVLRITLVKESKEKLQTERKYLRIEYSTKGSHLNYIEHVHNSVIRKRPD